ncbi:hypothetical protein FRC12_008801 [Ceratobasidium sp. 428]|nr:hypothetical protein FRC12_008801 [Ceratobasidium sp. 428]
MTITSGAFVLPPSPPPVSFYSHVVSVFKLVWVSLTSENPLVWSFVHGRAHPRADVSGPYYIVGALNVNFALGKAVLGATQDLKRSPLFLLSGKILGPSDEPVEATLDLWQADTSGVYSHATYRNRGKATTDPTTGGFEILTVPPREYGFSPSLMRAAHIHAIITAPRYQSLVTQLYVSPGNDPKPLDNDFINWMRSKRLGNMLSCWAIPTDKGDLFNHFPRLQDAEEESAKMVEEWNDRLQNEGLKVGCGASTIIKLNKA